VLLKHATLVRLHIRIGSDNVGAASENKTDRIEPTRVSSAKIDHKNPREDEDTYPQSQSQSSSVSGSPLKEPLDNGPERGRTTRRMIETLRRNVLPGWTPGRQKVDAVTQTMASSTNNSWHSYSFSSELTTSAVILVRFEDRKLGIKIGQVTLYIY
jgi:hypothetical protein